MMKKTKHLLALILLMGVFFACNKKDSVVTETRQLSAFSKLEVNGVSNLVIEVEKSSSSEAKIEAKESLMQAIQTVVDGGELSIDIEAGQVTDPDIPIKINIKTPNIDGFNFNGDGKVTLKSMEGELVEIGQSGRGTIIATINATKVIIESQGSGPITVNAESQDFLYDAVGGDGIATFKGSSTNATFEIVEEGITIHAFDFIVNDLGVNIIGSAELEVHVLDFLTVDISGEGTIYYKGNPEIDSNIVGDGSIIDAN